MTDKRSFEHRVSVAEIAGTVVLAVVALWCFWHPTAVYIFAGGAFTMITVMAIDRLLHTSYTVGDGILTISRGRFGSKKVVKLSEINAVTKVKTLFFRYILIEYGGGKHTTATPVNEDEFIRKIKK